MIAASRAVIEPDGVLRHVRCEPPLTLRQLRSDDPTVCALGIVGSAAGPLAGDQIDLDLLVAADASASLESVGALLVQGRGAGAPSSVRTRVVLGAGSRLTAAPQPVVVCAGGHVELALSIDLDPQATLVWREVVVLGRSAEPPGTAVVDWDIRRAGQPLLRQRLDLTAAPLWSGLLGGHRVLASELRVGPAVRAETRVHSGRAVTLRVDEHCELASVIAHDAVAASTELDALRAALLVGAAPE